MKGISLGADEIRTTLHLLGVAVWIGGQIVMMGLVPALRKMGGEAPRLAAAAFGRVAWPAFGLAVATGIWNLMAVDLGEVTSGYNAAFGIKMLLVLASGGAAAVHQNTSTPAVRAATGAVGFLGAIGALIAGVLMTH